MSVLVLVALLSFTPPNGASPDLPITIHRVSSRVAVASYVSNNVAAIATERGVLIVDGHRSPTIMRAILSSVEGELGRDDWTWLVNTHGHWDHTWGNQAVAGATRIGHTGCAETIEDHAARRRLTEWRQEVALERMRAEAADTVGTTRDRSRLMERLQAQKIIVDDMHLDFVPAPPDDTFDDRMRIDAGDVTAEMIFCGTAHTDHDIFVFVPGENLLLTGDVFCSGNSFCFGVNALTDGDRLLAVIDEILERSPDELVIVPGHGGLLNRDDLVRLRGVLATKWAGVDVAHSAAKRLADGEGIDGVAGLEFDEEEFHVLARRHIGRGRLARARAVLDIALEHLPGSALLHDLLGETLFDMGDIAGAREHYERSLELSPRNRNAAEVLKLLVGEAR